MDKESFNVLLQILCAFTVLISFIATISWFVLKGKIMEDVSVLIEKKITEFDRSNELVRVERQQKYSQSIETIKESIKRQEENSKENSALIIDTLNDIKAEMHSLSKTQTNHESRILSLEARKT